MNEVSLRGMRFHSLVGILPHEHTMPQPIEIDLTVIVLPDDLVDYRMLYDLTADVIASGHIDHLEDIGTRVATAALASTPSVRIARVAVRKPHVPLPGPLAHAEVVVVRTADA